MLRNAVGVSEFPEKALQGCTVQRLALRGGGLVSNFQKTKRYVTLEWPLSKPRHTVTVMNLIRLCYVGVSIHVMQVSYHIMP